MDPLNRITINKKDFTETEIIIAKKIFEDPSVVVRDTIITVASKMDVSKSALLRFCQKIGYEGFSEFKYELTRFMNASVDVHEADVDCVHWIQESIESMNTIAFTESLEKTAHIILSSPNVKIFGINESGLSARQLYYRLLSLGIESTVIVETEVMHYYQNIKRSNEVNIFFSLSAMTAAITSTLDNALENKKTTVLVTQNLSSEYIDKVDSTIILPSINPLGKRRFIDPQLLNFIAIELLVTTISNTLIKNNERRYE